MKFACLIASCVLLFNPGAFAVTVEQLISREQREMDVTGKHLVAGRDGYVYVMNIGYVLRFKRDGSGKAGFRPSYAAWNIAANADGTIAVACGHMDKCVRFCNPQLQELLAARGEFETSDKLGWMAPCDVQTGPSGDFYASDQHRGRIVRLDPRGKKVAAYSLDAAGENYVWYLIRMRVVEPLERFYVAGPAGNIHAIAFDGKKLWTLKAGLHGQGQVWKDYAGDFDADDQGNLYVLRSMTDTIEVYDKDGKPSGKIALEMGDRKGSKLSLQVSGGDVFVKREHKTEFFQIYDRKTGKLRRVVNAGVETVRMEYASDVWTAGQPMPFAVTIEAPGRKTTPGWPVRLAMYNDPQWQTLPIIDGKVTPPADASGLYQIRVGYGEYRLDAAVEIRTPGSRGTVSILTPLNRVYYGRGEEIPVTVIVRGGDAAASGPIPITVRDRLNAAEVLRIAGEDITWNGAVGTFTIPPAAGAKLRPGRYVVTADAEGMTVAPQPLVIGPGLRERPVFNVIQGGDGYHPLIEGGLFDAPSEVAAQAVRAQKLGINMFMDRFGDMDMTTLPRGADEIAARLKNDPMAVAPEKARVENTNLHAIAARGAFGIEEHGILLHMDTSLPCLRDGEENPGGWMPLGRLADWQKGVKACTAAALPYAAFRGWSWACNWWYNDDYALRHINVKKEAWPALRKKVLDSGQWDPDVVRLSDAWVSVIPEVDRGLTAALQEVAPGKVNAVTGPYRQPGVIPPLSFSTAGEIDLFCQSEQLQIPFMTPHNVDFYKRPGKRAFGHPETINEDGTGGMIMSIVMQQAVRGADGTGWEGDLPANKHHRSGPGIRAEDERSTFQGRVSAFRAMNAILRHYGPWLTALEPSDRIAIVVSTRMMRLDWWDGDGHLGGTYFKRLFEAYNACLYAHRPASHVFAEDLAPGTLTKYKALLVVGQRVELDPPLAQALADAMAAGVRVFYDGTCREEHVKGFTPLNVTFDRVENQPALMNCDLVYHLLPPLLKQEAEGLVKALGSIVAPVADVANPEVMLTERVNGEGRFVWVLNNDLPDLEPWQMWRLGSYVSHRVPQMAPAKLDAAGSTVYDVFAMQQVKADPVADLRTLPVRLYAILPRPIDGIRLSAPEALAAGGDLAWELAVDGPEMTYPARLRLLDADGAILEESFPVKTAGAFTVPLNAGPALTLEAVELISGKKSQQRIQVNGGLTVVNGRTPAKAPDPLPVQRLFGPHLRDVAVSQDGSAALINAMNWTDNYFLLNTRNGSVRSQGSIGHHYAYGPLAGKSTFYLQGYDLTTPEGYHLYDLGENGKPTRRFATYGLPQRQTLWFGSVLVDNVNGFAVSPDGRWIANAGNLGLVVWSRNGKTLWTLDWWKTARKKVFLLVQDEDTLVTLDGMAIAAYRAMTGEKLWEIALGDVGTLQGGAVCADGRTLAAWSDTWGGRVFVIRDRKLVNTFFALPDNICLTPDGRHLAMSIRRELRWYAVDGGIEWVFTGDDWLHNVRIAPDGAKIAVGSDLGTLCVLDDRGRTHLERDFAASPVARWLKGGDLLVATWMGNVTRLAADGSEKWNVQLHPKAPSRLLAPPIPDELSTLRPSWAAAARSTEPPAGNLLAETNAVVRITDDRVPTYVFPIKLAALTDGKPQPPNEPWVKWTSVGMAESGWCGKIVIEVECPQQRISVSSITFVEDPDHPESWLRNMIMQVWNPETQMWMDCPPLLSDSAVHTHEFEKPIIGSKFRFLGDSSKADAPGFERAGLGGIGWPVGNIRLGEIAFHGTIIGPR